MSEKNPPGLICPGCDAEIGERETYIAGEEVGNASPSTGDLTLCWHCRTLSVYDFRGEKPALVPVDDFDGLSELEKAAAKAQTEVFFSDQKSPRIPRFMRDE